MIALLSLAAPILVFSVWIYFSRAPGKMKNRRTFEIMVGSTLAIGVVIITRMNYLSMVGTNDEAWWPVAALVSNLAFVPLLLIVAFVVRIALNRRTEQDDSLKP